MTSTIQKNVLHYLSKQHQSSKSLISALQTVLAVSQSAAYKRLNGSSPLSLIELEILISHFQIPAHVITNTYKANISFTFPPFSDVSTQKYNFIETVHEELTRLISGANGQVTYTSIDVPFFYYFMYKELAAFKVFHFKHSVSKASVKELPKIALTSISQEEETVFKDIVSMYSRIKSDEVWTSQVLKVTANEILYFYKLKLFQYPEEALLLLDQLLLLSDQLFKILSKQNKGLMISRNTKGAILNVHYNDFTRFNSVIITQTDLHSNLFITYDIPNFLRSTNQSFIDYTIDLTQKLRQKAHSLSSASEVQLLDFFNEKNEYIKQIKNKISLVLK